MGEFFKPWRRRIGVLTLGLALVFMAAWVRSNGVSEGLAFEPCSTQYGVAHSRGYFALFRKPSGNGLRFGSWSFAPDPDSGPQGPIPPMVMDEDVLIVPPYWSIVMPLTALSACLLLTKPSKTNAKKSGEPIANEGK